MNFAEQVAYWYLRFNGFLPLTNFVHHQVTGSHRTSDSDIIAVRFPHVFEPIGGQPDDWDCDRFEKWGIDMRRTLGFIVEVKSGGWSLGPLENRNWRIADNIKRLGMVTIEVADELSCQLSHQRTIDYGDFTFAKLLVTRNYQRNAPWLDLTLNDAVKFIQKRMKRYENRKERDRMFFDSDLIQFLAWKAGLHS